MSTQKEKISNPRLARRRIESILAESLISKICDWRVEFLSGGYDSYEMEELVDLTKKICEVTSQKQWLNIGVLKQEELKKFLPYIEGVSGAVECVNYEIRKRVCPSKPLEEVFEMFRVAKKLGLKNSLTIIIGLGETTKDYDNLKKIIDEYGINRITFYALNPHEETPHKTGPSTEYYASWIKKTRKDYPSLEIVAGSWVDRLSEISELLRAGANHITKFPSIRLFGTKHAEIIEEEVRKANAVFLSNLTKIPTEDIKKLINELSFDTSLKRRILERTNKYLKKMNNNITK